MDQRTQMFLLLVFMQFSAMAADTANQDIRALKSLKDAWTDRPPIWEGSDPCSEGWDGIVCTNSRVTSIKLATVGLTGYLSGDIELLSELQTLDLSYNKGLTGSLPKEIGSLKNLSSLFLVGCGFSGSIPDRIGSLQKLRYLSLNSNNFSGRIPPYIGSLSNLYWLDLADNQLDGPIPVSHGSTPGLDMLLHAGHFHLGKNMLSDTIPPQLFSSEMVLIHVLLEGNKLTGSIPSTLGLVQTLEVVRFDRNQLSGHVPSNLSNLTKVTQLLLSNNKLTGPVPNLTGLNLSYVDMSNNSFDVSDFPPWFSTLKFLTTLVMENTHLQGKIPAALFELPRLQTVVLRSNQLNGSLDIDRNYSNQLQLIDLQNNLISELEEETRDCKVKSIILRDNPFCTEGAEETYCRVPQPHTQPNYSYSTPENNCKSVPCSSNQISSPNCICAHPYTGILVFRAPSFSNLEDKSYFEKLKSSLMLFFRTHHLPVDSVSLSNPFKDPSDYLELSLKVFPSGSDSFNITGLSSIGFIFSNQTFKPPREFGPFFFNAENNNFHEEKSKKSSSIGIIIGLAAGGSIVLLVLLLAGVYAFRQKKRAERAIEQSHPFAQWDLKKSNSSVPELKGARWFSFEELQQCTNNFSEANQIGSGGYGKVYRGSLPTGQLIAVKRAQKESMQGGLEFKTEIELLSRVHHKNLVGLVGYCFQKGEQMLVYDFVPNGSLKDSLTGKSGIRLDWTRRLKLALGIARGLAYLHEFANPPIIHRDIKSNNILLDESLNAKVSDFGLSKSKPIGDGGKSHVSTQVKGTMGYLDPEYYMSNQLTERSDVYSFGVLMLELITARKPIEHGNYIVRVVKTAMDKTKDLYNLQELLDPTIGLGTNLKGLEKMVDLAMACVKEPGTDRPTMGEVVKEIENILLLAGLNPNADSASTSASYEASKASSHHPYSDDSGLFSSSKIETPQ